MEIVKYLCEFFFCNFWHWLGLFVMLIFVHPFAYGMFNTFKEYNSKKEKD